MSVVLSTQYYTRTTNLPSITGYTMMCWAYTTTASAYQSAMCFGLNDPNKYESGFSNGNFFFIYNTSSHTGSANSTSTWYHIAVVCSGSGANQLKLYKDGNTTADITTDGNASITAGKFYIGNEFSGDQFLGRIAAVKIWNAALSASEVAAERDFAYPVRTSNINGAYLLQADVLTDVSGQGNTLTRNGTGITTAADPAGVDFNPISGYNHAIQSYGCQVTPAPIHYIGI